MHTDRPTVRPASIGPRGHRRRRLLTIGHSYCVGANRRLAHELARTGDWDVTVAGPARFRGDFAVHTMTPEVDEATTLAPLTTWMARPLHTMVYGWPLRSLLRERWDLVHCWAEPYVASAAQVAAWTPAPVPLVFATFQNIDKNYPPPFAWFERYVMNRADGLIAFGQTVRDVSTQRGFAARRTRVIPAGVDTARFTHDAAARAGIRASLGWDDGTPVIGFVGRFVPAKGLELLTDVLGSLREPWRALFVGSGPLESQLRRWAAAHGDRVAIATTVGHDQVPAWLNAMDLLCAPSQTTRQWREQFGRMLIEAFATGLPVVASDSGEIPHVVGSAGVIVGERDRAGWITALSELLRDPVRRAALGAAGRDRACTQFDWSVVARQHARFFEQVIDGTVSVAPYQVSTPGAVRA